MQGNGQRKPMIDFCGDFFAPFAVFLHYGNHVLSFRNINKVEEKGVKKELL